MPDAAPSQPGGSSARFTGVIPGWLRAYSWSRIFVDAVAGFTLWGLVVPEAIAYSSLAGLPPQAGLYTLVAGLLVYALLGTSRQLVTSATSATAVTVGATVAALRPPDATTALALAGVLVLAVGAAFLVAGFARLGFITQFLSRPVTEGFVLGLAIFVAVGQLDKLFGVEKGHGNVPEKLWHIVRHLGDANGATILVSCVALVALFALPKVTPRLPTGLIVLAAGIAVSAALDLHGRWLVETVGTLPSGLPRVDVPSVRVADLYTLLPTAFAILLLGFSESLGIAEGIAARDHTEIDPNRELRAFGFANVASGLFGGMVASGSMSASSVNEGAGARTQMSGLVAWAMVLVTLVALTPLFTTLPEAVLGALIIHAVSHHMSARELRAVRRFSRPEFGLAVLALGGVLLLDVLAGLLIAMAASLIVFIAGATRPHIAVLGRDADAPSQFVDVARNPAARTVPGVLIVRLDAPLFYANATTFRDGVRALVRAAQPAVDTVIFHPESQYRLDLTSADMLVKLAEWLRAAGCMLYVTRLHRDLRDDAERAGLVAAIGEEHIVADIPTALTAIGR